MTRPGAGAVKIYVDADACPNVIKEILFRAAERLQIQLILVANQPVKAPPSKVVRTQQVSSGFDEADAWIEAQVQAGDLVITADIPLAADVVARDAHALSPRGELYGKENIRELLDMRNFMDTLRNTGVDTGGPPAFSAADGKAFARRLDGLLARHQAAARKRAGDDA